MLSIARNCPYSDRVIESAIQESLSSGRYFADPFPLFDELRATAPVHYSETIGGWLLTRYDDSDRVLRDHETFSSKGRVTHLLNQLPIQTQERLRLLHAHFAIGLAHSDAPEHRRIRSLLSQSFTPKVMNSIRNEISTLATELIAKLQGDVDLIAYLLTPLPALVVGKLLGSTPSDIPDLIRWAHAVNGLYEKGGKISEDKALHAEAMLNEMRAFVTELVEARRRAKASGTLIGDEDVLSSLVAQEEEILSDQELLSTVVSLFVAGHETTTHLLGNGLLAILKEPKILDDARSAPEVIPLIVEEMARFDGSVPRSWRLTKSDVEIGGTEISKGSLVLPMLAAANRDPEHFKEPNSFDYNRENKRHLAYGKGVHVCLGAPLARIEAQEVLIAMLHRFKNIELAEEPERLEWRRDLALRGLIRLPVRLN